MAENGAETDALLEQAVRGDDQARQRLLERHRSRLKRMVGVRMDSRLDRLFRSTRNSNFRGGAAVL